MEKKMLHGNIRLRYNARILEYFSLCRILPKITDSSRRLSFRALVLSHTLLVDRRKIFTGCYIIPALFLHY